MGMPSGSSWVGWRMAAAPWLPGLRQRVHWPAWARHGRKVRTATLVAMADKGCACQIRVAATCSACCAAGAMNPVAGQLCAHLGLPRAGLRILCGLTAMHWAQHARAEEGSPGALPAAVLDTLLQTLPAPASSVTATGEAWLRSTALWL